MKNVRDIIKRPVITEHSADLMADKKYTFEVDPRAKKPEIKTAVETAIDVKVKSVNTTCHIEITSVNTMNLQGKFKRIGQYGGYRSDRKKAIVQLTEDSKDLDSFEG